MEIKKQVAKRIIQNLIHQMWAEPAPEEYWENGEVVYHTGFAEESLDKTVQTIHSLYLGWFKDMVESMAVDNPYVGSDTNAAIEHYSKQEAFDEAIQSCKEQILGGLNEAHTVKEDKHQEA